MFKRFALFTALILLLAPSSFAYEYGAELEGDGPGPLAAKRLKRGLTNAATFWVELPKQITKETEETHIGYGLTKGLVYGVYRSIARAGVGVFDSTTFLFSEKGENLPVMDPEYVWEPKPHDPDADPWFEDDGSSGGTLKGIFDDTTPVEVKEEKKNVDFHRNYRGKDSEPQDY